MDFDEAEELLVGYGPYEPDRFINWRWLHAEDLATAFPGFPCENEDRWVEYAARYFQTNQASPKRRRRFKSYVLVERALAIHTGDELRRDILEARLLADETYDDISERMDLSKKAIEGYEKLFFDFRRKRESKLWISEHAIRLDMRCGTPPSLGIVLRKYGFHGGRYMLEYLLEFVERFTGDNLAADLPDLKTPEGLHELSVRCFLATELLPKTLDNCQRVLRLQCEIQQAIKQREKETETGMGDLTEDNVADAVGRAFDAAESCDDLSVGAASKRA
jgi:hypothetical protein